MRTPSEQFQQSTLIAVNALRLAAHAIGRGGDTTVNGDDAISIDSHQAVVSFARVDETLLIDVEPKADREAGNHRARLHMTRATLIGSPMFDMPIGDLPTYFAASFDQMASGGMIRWIEHEGDEVCIVHANPTGRDAIAAEAVDAIGRGIDALTGKASIYMRHPGLGTTPAFDPLSANGDVASVPAEDDPDQDRRGAGARIRMAREWMTSLPAAIVLRPLEEERNYGIWSHAMTIAPPEDRSDALRRSIKAYMTLSSMKRDDQA